MPSSENLDVPHSQPLLSIIILSSVGNPDISMNGSDTHVPSGFIALIGSVPEELVSHRLL